MPYNSSRRDMISLYNEGVMYMTDKFQIVGSLLRPEER